MRRQRPFSLRRWPGRGGEPIAVVGGAPHDRADVTYTPFVGETIVGTGAAAWGPTGVLGRVALVPYEPRRYADGCCETIPPEDRPAVFDCLDDPNAARPPSLLDANRREVRRAHAFAPRESDTDYALCQNRLDDDCSGADVRCKLRKDADRDGVSLVDDCDDLNPEVGPDVPGDGVDQNCDGRDVAGSDRDGDGDFARAAEQGGAVDCDGLTDEALACE
jgi:hypothetical protein